MRLRTNHRKRAISLVEILVASAFLGICAASVTDTLGATLSQIARMERRSIALNLVKNELEVWVATCQNSNPGATTINKTSTLPGGVTCSIRIDVGAEGSSTYEDIQVRASWPERKGTRNYTEQLTLKTYARSPNE